MTVVAGMGALTRRPIGMGMLRQIDQEAATVPPTLTRFWKTAGATGSYNAGAYTPLQYAGNFEITARRLRANDQNALGMSWDTDLDEDYESNFGTIVADSGALYYVNGAAFVNTGSTVAVGDYWRVARTISDGAIKIYTSPDAATWTLRHTFSGTSVAPMRAKISIPVSQGVFTVEATEGGNASAPTWTCVSGNVTIGTPTLVTPNSLTFVAGATITVTFTGGISASDWINLVAVATSDFSFSPIAWKYLNDTQVVPGAPVASGSITLTAPSAGSYKIMMMHHNQGIPASKIVPITVT